MRCASCSCRWRRWAPTLQWTCRTDQGYRRCRRVSRQDRTPSPSTAGERTPRSCCCRCPECLVRTVPRCGAWWEDPRVRPGRRRPLLSGRCAPRMRYSSMRGLVLGCSVCCSVPSGRTPATREPCLTGSTGCGTASSRSQWSTCLMRSGSRRPRWEDLSTSPCSPTLAQMTRETATRTRCSRCSGRQLPWVRCSGFPARVPQRSFATSPGWPRRWERSKSCPQTARAAGRRCWWPAQGAAA